MTSSKPNVRTARGSSTLPDEDVELKVPNAQTREAMAEADRMIAGQSARFDDGSSTIESLDRDHAENT